MAKGFDHIRLQINEPGGEDRHQADLNAEQSPRRTIAVSRENRQRKSDRIRRRSKNRQRNAGDLRIRTRQNRFTAVDDTAGNRSARIMLVS